MNYGCQISWVRDDKHLLSRHSLEFNLIIIHYDYSYYSQFNEFEETQTTRKDIIFLKLNKQGFEFRAHWPQSLSSFTTLVLF